MSIRISSICLSVWLVGFVSLAGSLQAEEGDWKCRTPYRIFGHKAEVDSREVPPKTLYERHARAGHPQKISPLADWSNTSTYWGYYVGGGNPYKFGGKRLAGERRYTRCEGTWGWDYVPFYSHVRLRWWHGRKYQDGEGQYKQNGKAEPLSPEHGPKGFIRNGLIR